MFIVIGVVIIVILLIYLFPLAKVYGTSMLPTFKEGNILICTRIFTDALEKGEIYIFKSPSGRLAIKRLMKAKLNPDLTFDCWFEGDNFAESYDSRNYGYINEEKIVAKVLWKLK